MKPKRRTVLIAAGIAIACGGAWLAFQQPKPSRSGAAPSATATDATGSHERHMVADDSTSTDASSSQTAGRDANQSFADELERVHRILNGDGASSAVDRVAALRQIGGEITAPEIDAFYQYLAAPSGVSPDPAGENWVRNELMDMLVDQPTVPAGLASLLDTIYRTADQDVVMRDYALQHMSAIYGRISEQEQCVLRDALWEGVEETDCSIGGTSLLGLLEVRGSVGSSNSAVDSLSEDYSTLAQAALQMAANANSGDLSRITAVQVCGRMNIKQSLPVLAQVAQEAESMPLRIAATAALGDLGGPETVLLLQQLSASPDSRLALAANAAEHRIRERSGEL